MGDLAFGTTLVTSSRRVRPEYVQYARVAKKVDVRRLKEELWKEMALEKLAGKGAAAAADKAAAAAAAAQARRTTDASRLLTPPPGETSRDEKAGQQDEQQDHEQQDADSGSGDSVLKFTDVMNGLQGVYPKAVMKDISTSYCFICLLHLANEKGLIIDKTHELTDLDIRKDWTAEVVAEA